MADNNFSAWGKIKPILEEKGVNLASISIAHDCNNNNIVQNLIKKIGEDELFKALERSGTKVYNESEGCNVIYSDNDFVICSNGKAFLSNPYNTSILQQTYLQAKQISAKVEEIGVISPDSKVLGRKLISAKSSFAETDVRYLIDFMVMESIDNKVTDIHIYPRNEEHIFIKFRINGQLLESGINDISFNDYKLLANTLLNMAKKNPGVYSNFQEAAFDYECSIGMVSVRLQMNPTIYAFKESNKICPSFILRVHRIDKVSFRSIESLGFIKEHEQILKRSAKHNQGLILVSGPTNSGKTTALYGILAETMMYRDVCVQTVEDPVEVVLPGVKQLNINEEAGVNYANALKSILRSDVDVALVGEIRDPITAQKSVELDKTGHLVLSTLHTKTSLAIIDRLRQFGVSNTDIGDSLSVLISTRLLPEVCIKCSTEIEAGENIRIADKFKHKIKDLSAKIRVRNSKGCPNCNIGYSGRVMAAEVFFMDDTIRGMIAQGSEQHEIYRHITQKNKNKTIWDHGFEILLAGKTTFEDMEQLLPTYIDVGDDFSPEHYKKV